MQYNPPKKHKIGETRIVKRWAIFPEYCPDINKMVWMESYYEKQICNFCYERGHYWYSFRAAKHSETLK